jgi:hypothetical protein
MKRLAFFLLSLLLCLPHELASQGRAKGAYSKDGTCTQPRVLSGSYDNGRSGSSPDAGIDGYYRSDGTYVQMSSRSGNASAGAQYTEDRNSSPVEASVDRSAFWHDMQRNKSSITEYESDNSKWASKIKNDFKRFLGNLDWADDLTYEEPNADEIEVLEYLCGENYARYVKKFTVLDDGEINAYAHPNGHVFVTKKLMRRLKDNEAGIVGILAHEVAHIVLKHAEVRNYVDLKRKRKNNSDEILYAYVMTGSRMELNSTASAIFSHFKYSKQQELDADRAACEFLLLIGESPADYIRALLAITDDPYYEDPFDNHPSIAYRVTTLKELYGLQ